MLYSEVSEQKKTTRKGRTKMEATILIIAALAILRAVVTGDWAE